MKTEPFRFKQFSVIHDKCAMKVGTDGVVLGALADLNNSKRILDIGTGSGLIALMAAQKNHEALIDAVEIDVDSFSQARINFDKSKWADRLHAYNENIENFDYGVKYDTILCNPPYFKDGIRSKLNQRDSARSSNNLSQANLLNAVKRLLNFTGSLFVIYPFKEGNEFIELAKSSDLFLTRKTTVHSKESLPPERLVMEFKMQIAQPVDEQLIIYKSESGILHYTSEYISITKDFYLYM